MIEVVLSRIIQGGLSGIGVGFLFYCYPFVRHLVSRDYRFRFYQSEDKNLAFKKECIKYLKDWINLWFYLWFSNGNHNWSIRSTEWNLT